MIEIFLGNGDVLLQTVEQEGKHGILIRPNQEKHKIDESLPLDDDRNKEYIRKEGDVIIWCSNIESARVLQDKANVIALRLNGYDDKFENVVKIP